MFKYHPDDYGQRGKTMQDEIELNNLREKSLNDDRHIELLKMHIALIGADLHELRKKLAVAGHLKASDHSLPAPTSRIDNLLPPNQYLFK